MLRNKTGQDLIDFITSNKLEDKEYTVVTFNKDVYVEEEDMIEATIVDMKSILESGHPGFALIVKF